jgi:hypothetical protein
MSVDIKWSRVLAVAIGFGLANGMPFITHTWPLIGHV